MSCTYVLILSTIHPNRQSAILTAEKVVAKPGALFRKFALSTVTSTVTWWMRCKFKTPLPNPQAFITSLPVSIQTQCNFIFRKSIILICRTQVGSANVCHTLYTHNVWTETGRGTSQLLWVFGTIAQIVRSSKCGCALLSPSLTLSYSLSMLVWTLCLFFSFK